MFGRAAKIDPHRFALMADTHINADSAAFDRGINMTENMKQVAHEIVSLDPRPASVFVVGDLAHHDGESADYATFARLLQKMREADLSVHLALGNHDHRERFWQAIPPQHGEDKQVENRNVALVKSARANFFVLDSLHRTNGIPGMCGEAQLQWLAEALDANDGKPAITMVHHQPDTRPIIEGLLDFEALLEVILPRKQVKAHIFGHTHDWRLEIREGLHLLNLPPVAYVFARGRPNGWVDMRLERDRARLELRTVSPTHEDNHKRIMLKWR